MKFAVHVAIPLSVRDENCCGYDYFLQKVALKIFEQLVAEPLNCRCQGHISKQSLTSYLEKAFADW